MLLVLTRDLDCHRCEALSENAYQEDTLILAGDISDDQAILRSTFELMVRKFQHVFFVPGNHDLWVRRKERGVLDSLGDSLQINLHPILHVDSCTVPLENNVAQCNFCAALLSKSNPLPACREARGHQGSLQGIRGAHGAGADRRRLDRADILLVSCFL